MLCRRIKVVASGLLVALFEFLARAVRHQQGSNADGRPRHSGNARETQSPDINSGYVGMVSDGLAQWQVAGNTDLHLTTCQHALGPAQSTNLAVGKLRAVIRR